MVVYGWNYITKCVLCQFVSLIYKTAWVAFKNNWPSERIAQHLKQIGLMAPDKVRAFENAIQKVSAKTDNILVQNIYNFLEKE